MKRLLSLIVAVVLLSPALVRADNLTVEWMEHAFCSRDVVGGAVIVSRCGEEVFSYTYGSGNARKSVPVTLDTCYRIASVTKMVTAVGLMQLYEQGYFRLDDPLGQRLPFDVVNSSYRDQPITIRQVLSHTSGAKQTIHTQINWGKLSQGNTGRYFKENARPGKKYVYSNINGGLFGALIEALSGESLNTYMSKNVFQPLDMNADYTARLLPDTSDISNQMSKKGGNMKSAEVALQDEYDDTCNPAAHLSYSVGGLVYKRKCAQPSWNDAVPGGQSERSANSEP